MLEAFEKEQMRLDSFDHQRAGDAQEGIDIDQS